MSFQTFLHSLQERMQTACGDSMELELNHEIHGERTLAEVDLLEDFAQNMADSIMESFLSMMAEEKVSISDPDQMLAEEMALVIIETALGEVCLAQSAKDQTEGSQTACKKTENESFMEYSKVDLMDTSPTKKIYSVPPPHPPLYQSGLPVVGSLDYPDAPPTTPLIPELERSRHSFAQKLKGGLANAFLPSPPPPTPKDKEEKSSIDPHMVLMEHLMHSLCTDDLPKGGYEEAPQHGAGIEHFAETLSCDIMTGVLSVKGKEEIQDTINLDLLAQQMAETIITLSLDKTKML